MLFPDWANAQEVTLLTDDSHTVQQDSFIITLENEENNYSSVGVRVNGILVFSATQNSTIKNNAPCFYCPKGTILEKRGTGRAAFKIFPLIKVEGGLELALIILSQPKINQRRETYAIK